MNKDMYLKAMELFEVPERFNEVAKLMLTDKEIELIVLMGKERHLESDLEKLVVEKGLVRDGKELIKSAYNRAVLMKEMNEEGDKLHYKITDLYSRYPYYAQYEYEDYGKVPREIKEDLFEWALNTFIPVRGEVIKAAMNEETLKTEDSYFGTLEESMAMIDKQDFIYVVPCDCKSMKYYQDKPRNTCLWFKTGINYHYDRGHGELLTKEEAKELVLEINKKGLMQAPDSTCFCNCDALSCFPLNAAKEMNSRPYYPKSNHKITYNQDECINCGICTRICNFEAFYFDENDEVQYDPEKCWECTICVPNCPTGAIQTEKKNF